MCLVDIPLEANRKLYSSTNPAYGSSCCEATARSPPSGYPRTTEGEKTAHKPLTCLYSRATIVSMKGAKVKLTFRFDEELLARFKSRVALERTTMTAVLHRLVREYLEEKEAKDDEAN